MSDWTVDLMLGDCLEMMGEIEDGSVDLCIADPPYGMSYQSNRRVVKDKFARIANDDTLAWLPDWMAEVDRVLKPDTAFYCFCSWHHIDTFKRAFEARFALKNVLVWVKNNHGSGDLTGGLRPKARVRSVRAQGAIPVPRKEVAGCVRVPENIIREAGPPHGKEHRYARGVRA